MPRWIFNWFLLTYTQVMSGVGSNSSRINDLSLIGFKTFHNQNKQENCLFFLYWWGECSLHVQITPEHQNRQKSIIQLMHMLMWILKPSRMTQGILMEKRFVCQNSHPAMRFYCQNLLLKDYISTIICNIRMSERIATFST